MPLRRHPRPELLLSIGGVVGHLHLEGMPAALLADVRRRYAAFALPCSPTVERMFSLTVTMRPERTVAPDPEESALPPIVNTTADEVEISRLDFAAHLYRIGASYEGSGSCQANHVAFESLLRVLWSVFLPRAGGALFHACGFHEGARGVLAPGPSGAGKTTLARKVTNPDDVLSDEVVAVHRGVDGSWRLSGTPFFGELQRAAVSMQSWPLGGIALLEKAPALATSPVAPGEAVLRTLACLLCFETGAEAVKQNFAIAIALATEVPVFACQSRVDTPYPELLAEIRRRLAPAPTRESPTQTPREMVSALRAALVKHGQYAFAATGSSMRPWLRSGDALFIEAAHEGDLVPGDVALYWRAGRSPERDALICHRVVGRVATEEGARIWAKGDALAGLESFEDGKEAEVIGRVRGISRGGQPAPLPGRLGNLAILVGSLLSIPFLWLLEHR